MRNKLANFLLAFLLLSTISSFAQRGKDGNYTVTATNTIVNSYTYLTANVISGTSSITVNSNVMSGGAFTGNLAAGDLILIIQMQGASLDIDVTPTTGWGGTYTVPYEYLWDFNWLQDISKIAYWGKVQDYLNSGKFEQREVSSVSGTTIINLNCPLSNSYTSTGHVQVIRVPRFNDLTLNTSTSLVPTVWDGQTGGVLAVEVNGDLLLNSSSKISASAKGFRGALANNVGGIGSTTQHANGGGNGASQPGSSSQTEGGRKGEGIGGYTPEYLALYSSFGRGSAANGGGGGGFQNAGGGGGSNIGTGTYTGKGVPSTTYAASIWNLELGGFGGSTSPGGGRGGYSLSSSNQDATTLGPNQSAWSGDARKENGGFGGHSLVYDASRLFMGGGGGAGDQDQNQGGAGGAGGGIVFVTCYGTISGSGSFESDGAVGGNTNPLNQSTSPVPSTSNKKGNDGAGGGGAGGSIYIKNSSAIPATISANARGGNGGNHNLTVGVGASSEGNGPGGGGQGGNIAFTSGTPVQTVSGGTNGTSNSSHLSEFVANGATNGSIGVTSIANPTFNITANDVSICSGNSVILTATVTGTLPGTLTWYSQPYGGSSIGTGTTYTTPVLSTTTTYYVGVCPGTFRESVVVTVNPIPTINGTAVLTNPTCSTAGSITGLSVSGGTPTYTYVWSGTTTAGPDYLNIPAGTYTLTVTDLNGCTDTDGPYTLTGISGPIIDASGVVVQNQSCNGTLGSITGITATGTGLTYSWSNGGGSSLNAMNLTAGSYTLTVTDGNGCTATSGPYAITFVAGPTINAGGISITSSTCGNPNGSITGITASGTGLTYAWNSVSYPSTTLSGQSAGNYTLVVTDANGCTASSGPYTINNIAGPTINIGSIAIVNENCNQANGSISGITISGGTASFNIAWTGTVQTSLDISNLAAGNYSITVSDFYGCIANAGPFTINNSGGPTINTSGVALVDQNCNGTLGSITGITASGTSLNYSWSNGGGNSLNATNLTAGNYTLTVTDGNGCAASAGPYTINFITGPTVSAAGITITPSTCGNPTGDITGITATGTGLIYSWNGTTTASTDLINQLGGNYTLTVTDANGCSVTSGPHTIPSVAGPSISSTGIVISPESCNQSDGSISGLVINGGTPVITLVWTGTSQTSIDIANLTAGNYSLQITDGNGCVANAGPFIVPNAAGPSIDETNAVSTNVLCDGTLGSITGLSATGTGLLYSWSNGGGNNLDAIDLVAGTYILTVTDGNGCSASSSPYTINDVVPLVLDQSNMLVTPTSCTANTGSISGIVVSGGVNPVISWSNSATTIDISSLAAGTYDLTVTDDQGCSENLSATITMVNAPVLDVSAVVIGTEHCGQNDGSISGITVSGGTPNYSYEWNNNSSLNTIDLNNVSSGVYTLIVTDSEGCSDSETLTINETLNPIIDPLNLAVENVSCNTLGSISGISVNGSGPLFYSWTNTSQTTLDITNLDAGSYTLTATDIYGCSSSMGPIDIIQTAGPTANFDYAPDAPGIDEDIVFTNTSSGIFITNSTWTILGQDYAFEDIQYSFSEPGIYAVTLTVQDMFGCIDSTTQLVTIYGNLIIPNVLTANGDDVNDLFEIQGLKPETAITILNRWGNVVFISDDYQNDWDGKDQSGTLLVDGVYTYILKDPNGKTEHGFVHLIK